MHCSIVKNYQSQLGVDLKCTNPGQAVYTPAAGLLR